MRLLFWLSFAVIAYTYVGYPAIMFLMARFAPCRWRKGNFNAPVSIVMAVHNGADKVQAQVAHLMSLDPERVREVIVVSDGSNDGTAETLAGLQDARLKKVILPEQVGKAAALNAGIAQAAGEILLFIDIRPKVAPGALAEMMSNFADPKVGCVAGELVLNTDGHDAAASAVSGVYWRYEQWIRNCEAAWDSPVGVYGGFYAARRSLVQSFPAGIILDDMYQPLAIIRQGYRSVLDRSAIVVDTWPGKVAGEFQRKVRTLAGNYQLLSLAPWTLSPRNRVLFQLVSHKLMRLVVPYFFLLLLLSATWLGVDDTAWRVVAAAQWAFWLAALASLRVHVPIVHRFVAAGGALLVLNLAAVVGLYKFLFTSGPLWKIWSPASSARSVARLEAKESA
ncbi:glycosyltransferase [Edaphobacter flagellatus]|uniref:glycosyltransferase n=1 Tax=Edaphobacter flagellatus TaxID=1933044 RepID=UPI0021B216FB|nr:glycosyltransferase [Edaphobacter flagellatus]